VFFNPRPGLFFGFWFSFVRVLEYWNTGILGLKVNFETAQEMLAPNTPIFQYSSIPPREQKKGHNSEA
jgi:hypothetical protein